MGRKGRPQRQLGDRGAMSAPGYQNLIQREVTESLGSMRLGFYAEGKAGGRPDRAFTNWKLGAAKSAGQVGWCVN
jgi:hypothetical protein